MRRGLLTLLGATALLSGLDPVFAHLAARRNVAGALLSPAGLDDPSAWLVALAYLLARLGSSALLCLSVGVLAALLVSRGVERLARRKAGVV